MKCQILFSGKKNRKFSNLSFAKFAKKFIKSSQK